MYTHIGTENDVMRESLIYGAELDGKYGMPMLKPFNATPSKTVDFHRSKKLKDVKKLNLNFFVHDYMLNPVFLNPDKYMEHLKCFGSVCGFDFTIDVKSPLALQIYNKYRNHVLSWYFQNNGVKIIPKVDLLPACSDWIYDGLPHESTLCCSTNGRAISKDAKKSFTDCFKEMESVLNPHRVIIVGTKFDFEHDCEIVWLETYLMNHFKKDLCVHNDETKETSTNVESSKCT